MPKRSRQDSFYNSDAERFHAAFVNDREWFKTLGDFYEPRTGDLLVHQDNGKKVLIVCHTDFIVPTIPAKDVDTAWLARYGPDAPLPEMSKFGPYCITNTGKWFPEDNIPVMPKSLPKAEEYQLSFDWVAEQAGKHQGPVVDDRLGCALALGCTSWADILFTDCEEQGRSTAAFFQAPRAYNWIIGFDRRGTDVVTYNYKDKDWLSALEEHFDIGTGSFSDIGYLEKLGTACVNMGIGYDKEHTTAAHWTPKDTEEQFARLYAFWSKYRDTQFHHLPPRTTATPSKELGRHEGKDQCSLHGREWLLDITPEPVKTLPPVKYIKPWKARDVYKPRPGMPTTVSNKSYGSGANRYQYTTIPATVWDEFAADYRSIGDLDLDDPSILEFIYAYYPTFADDLEAYKASRDADLPNDAFAREYGFV